MSNCLITKLAESVTDTSLPKLGVLRLELKAGITATGYLRSGNEKSVLSLVSGSLVLTHTNTAENIPLPYQILNDASQVTAVVGQDGAVIEITNKYDGVDNMTAILACISQCDLADFSYMENLLNFAITTNQLATISGDVASLATCKKLNNFSIGEGNVGPVGDISSFGPCTALATMNVYRTQLTGDLKELAKGQRASGRTTGSISFGWLSTNISFNGTPCDKRGASTLAWTENTITWDGTTINE